MIALNTFRLRMSLHQEEKLLNRLQVDRFKHNKGSVTHELIVDLIESCMEKIQVLKLKLEHS